MKERKKFRRFIGAGVAVLAMVILGMFGSAGGASASAEVCTVGPNVIDACSDVNGSGGHVNYVRAFFDGSKVCNYSARVRVSSYGNPNYRSWTRGVNPGSCGFLEVHLDFPVNETFPTGSSWVCTQTYISNAPQGRDMCIKLT